MGIGGLWKLKRIVFHWQGVNDFFHLFGPPSILLLAPSLIPYHSILIIPDGLKGFYSRSSHAFVEAPRLKHCVPESFFLLPSPSAIEYQSCRLLSKSSNRPKWKFCDRQTAFLFDSQVFQYLQPSTTAPGNTINKNLLAGFTARPLLGIWLAI